MVRYRLNVIILSPVKAASSSTGLAAHDPLAVCTLSAPCGDIAGGGGIRLSARFTQAPGYARTHARAVTQSLADAVARIRVQQLRHLHSRVTSSWSVQGAARPASPHDETRVR